MLEKFKKHILNGVLAKSRNNIEFATSNFGLLDYFIKKLLETSLMNKNYMFGLAKVIIFNCFFF